MTRETQSAHFQQLAEGLREELQVFYRALRHRRDRQHLTQAVERLRNALQTAEAAVQDPQQRYALPLAEQWGFVNIVNRPLCE